MVCIDSISALLHVSVMTFISLLQKEILWSLSLFHSVFYEGSLERHYPIFDNVDKDVGLGK